MTHVTDSPKSVTLRPLLVTCNFNNSARTLAVLSVVGDVGEARSTDAFVVVDEVDTVAERITWKVSAFVQFCRRTNI